jgi:hypothetical protein
LEGLNMKKFIAIIALIALVFLGLSPGELYAQRGGGHYGGGYHGGGYHGGYYYHGGPRVFIGGYFGFPYYYPYGYPYYYPYGYAYPSYPYTYDEPQVYIEQEQPSDWYYCRNPEGYYPYVASCPSGWTKVAPAPPPGRQGVER